MDLGLKGKTVIVTGGAKGIGSGISKVFAEEGANVVVNYRSDPEGCESFVQSLIDTYGVKAIGVQADVSKEEDVKKIYDAAEEAFGRIDILVNNAGSFDNHHVTELSLDRWNTMLNNNTTAFFMMAKEYAKRVIPQKHKGWIVNVLSKASMSTTSKGNACYVTNKTAELGLTRQLAVDLLEYGIFVNGVMPGMVRNKEIDANGGVNPKLHRAPLKRMHEPEEVGYVVAFLCSEKNQIMEGSAVDITGGLLLGF